MGDNLQAFRRTIAPRSGVAGFTVVELMVTVMCAAILAAVAVPSFQSTINNGRLSAASNELLASLQTARMEALRYNRRTIVCLSTNPTATNPTCAAANETNATGWITFVDANRNGDYNPGVAQERLLRVSTMPAKVHVLGSSNIPDKVSVTFRADGFARNASNDTYTGAFSICMNTKRPEENVRRVVVGGRMAVERAGVGDGQCEEPGN